MKRVAKKKRFCRVKMLAVSLMLMLVLGLSVEEFSITGHAQSEGKVTANSANIRKSPDSGSSVVGSATKDASVTINHQTTGSDGKIWYQVFVDANTLGYIRSDLVTITDGSTPTTVDSSSTTTTTTTNTNETPVAVTTVNPVSATVTGGENVRVRSNASTTSQIVTTVAKGSAITVNGKADGTDGRVWYQVAFISNGANVTGFIRSDYVNLSGELTPVTETPTVPETPTESEPPVESGETQENEETKAWETQLQGDKWYLLDMEHQGQYAIEDMFSAVKQNGDAFEESQQTVKSQKVVIIVLVIVVIVLCAAITMLIFKIKDMQDEEDFMRVERETIRGRNADRVQGSQKVMHTVGTDKKSGAQAGRPAGASVQGGRPAGARPAGAPAQGGRPAGARPAGAPTQGGRPTGAVPQGAKTAAPAQGAKPVAQKPQENNAQAAGHKSKNFMSDDDEFEFEFLNWDGEEQ